MKKSKIAAGVLLLAMGLTPVNSGLSYADDIEETQVEENTQAENVQTETIDKTTKDTDTVVENKDELEISDEKEMENQQENDVDPLVEDFSMEEFINNKVSEISATKLYKIATTDELNAFNANIENLKSESKDFDEEKSEEVANKIEEYSKVLGKTVVFAKPYRTRLRILTKIADEVLSKKNDDSLKKANETAKLYLSDKNISIEKLEKNLNDLYTKIGKYPDLKDLDNSSISLASYPTDLQEELGDKVYERDMEELVLEREGLVEYAKSISDSDLENISHFLFGKKYVADKYVESLKALINFEGNDLDEFNRLLSEYDVNTYKVEKELGEYKSKEEELGKKIKRIENLLNDEEFKKGESYTRNKKDNIAKYKEAYDNFKKAYDEKDVEKLDETMTKLEEIKSEIMKNTFSSKLAELRAAIDNPEEKNVSDEEFERIKKQYHEKLDAIENDKEKTLDDLLAFEKDELPTYKKLVNPEKEGGASGTTGTTGTTGNKKKVAKKVTTKKSKGKVRTGVESILPIAGGVAVVAAIALFLTRKKK